MKNDIKIEIITGSRKIELHFTKGEEISKHIIWNNLLHNTDGPAYLYKSPKNNFFDLEYYLCGVRIKSKKEWENIINNKEYILDRVYYKYYFKDQKLHREDGPAIDGPHKKYWIYGQNVSKEEWEEWRAKRWEIKEKRREIKVDNGIGIEMENYVVGKGK